MEHSRQQRLVVTAGLERGRIYPLQGMVCTLGRSSDNTIVLDSSKISRHHAQIRLLPTGAVIEDTGSTNGTWVNDRRLVEPHALLPGDIIRLADFVTFRYEEGEKEDAKTNRMTSGPVQVMEEPPAVPQDTPRPYQEPRAYESPAPPRESPPYHQEPEPEPYEQVSPVTPEPAYPSPPPASTVEEPAPVQRPKGLYVLIGLLALLICFCVALAVYLWFAPASFWERIFDMLGVPMPTGSLYTSTILTATSAVEIGLTLVSFSAICPFSSMMK